MTTPITIFYLVYFGFSLLHPAKSVKISEIDSVDFYIKKASYVGIPHDRRIFFNKKALALLELQSDDSTNLSKTFKVAENFFILNQWREMKFTSNVLLRNSIAKNNQFYLAKSYRYLGLYYENISKNDSAYYFYSKAEKIYLNSGNLRNLCIIYQDKSLIQYFTNNFSESESLLIKALRIAKKLKLENEKYKIYINLGLNSREQGDYDNSLLFFNKALKIVNERRVNIHSYHYEYCLNNIGRIYVLKKEYKVAERLFQEALSNEKIHFDPVIYTRLLDNFSKTEIELKHFSNVKKNLTTAQNYRKRFDILEGKNFNRLYLSEYYAAINDTATAIRYAREAYTLSKNFRAPSDMMHCLRQLSKLEPKNALEYSSEYIKISDSLHILERETRNKFAKIAYETEEITQEKELAIKHKLIFLGTTIAVTLCGILLIVIAWQRIKQKELLLTQSQQKAKEEVYKLIHTQQSKIDEGRQTEKMRIARDLHDGVMNKLASTRFNLHVLNNNADKKTIEKCIFHIDSIQDIEKEIRSIAHDLNKDVFSENDSFKRILVTFFEEQKEILNATIYAEIDNSIKWEYLKSSQEINLFRILQEAFQNINKHAEASHIFVSISNQVNYLLLEIHDDGVGFSVNDNKNGIGLQNLRARTKESNGVIHINSSFGYGTTIIVSMPLDKKQPA